MKRILLELLIILAIGGLIWIAVAFFIRMPEHPTLLSTETEAKMGENYANFIYTLEGFAKIETPYIQEVFDSTVSMLRKSQTEPNYYYQISVVDNSMVNAFALPGGYIIVTKGLIEFCETSEELLSVICHEIGHVEKRHVINRLIKDLGVQILTLGDGYIIGEISQTLLSSGYNRYQEEEADLFSCELMFAMQLEPRVLAGLFRRLNDENNENAYLDFEIVSSHPDFSKRIKSVLAFKVPKEFKPTKSWIDLGKLKQEIHDAE